MIVTCQQMRDAESRFFAAGGCAEPLMDEAGKGCAGAIREFFPRPGQAVLFCGSGNNGGDALVAGAWLRKWGWKVGLRLSHSPAEMSPLARKKLRELEGIPDGPCPGPGGTMVLVDGLLGIGSRGAIRGKLRPLADEMNRLRLERRAITFAIDIPSGLDGDTGEPYEGAVAADYTLSICAPKRGIIQDRAINHSGRIFPIPLPQLHLEEGDPSIELLTPDHLRNLLPRRLFDTHKGKAGRVAIIAGSRGLTGAAVLSALGALHGGSGLITLLVPEEIYPIVASRAPAEVMVRPRRGDPLDGASPDAMAIGPGLGPEVDESLLAWMLESSPIPMALDADALNWIAARPGAIGKLAGQPRILTPHPGELRRLTGESCEDRLSFTRRWAEQWDLTLLHKGARTVIATSGKKTGINSTGTPAMASGGMGDVLTGLVAALLAQGLCPHDAGCLGSWLLGRAAEKAEAAGAVTASRVAAELGPLIRSGLA